MAAGGEWLDMALEARQSTIQPDAAHWHDIWNTMFWPTVLLLIGRWLHPGGKPAPTTSDRGPILGEKDERRFEQASTVGAAIRAVDRAVGMRPHADHQSRSTDG